MLCQHYLQKILLNVYYEDMNNFEYTGDKLLTAVAYGDAAGLPVETKSAAYIAERYGKITQLLPPAENPFYTGNLPAGTWSDDTHLSLAVAKAIINANGFDLQSQAQSHIDAYHETPLVVSPNGKQTKQGWGGSTTRSVERIINGVSPHLAGEKDGAGNGILMKMSPLVFWQTVRGLNDTERYAQYDQLTTMTHDSDVARICTRVHGDTLHYLLTQEYEAKEFIESVVDCAIYHESLFGQDAHVSSRYITCSKTTIPRRNRFCHNSKTRKAGLSMGFTRQKR